MLCRGTASALAGPSPSCACLQSDQQQYYASRDRTDFFTNVEHRCFVDFTFTNDDGAVNVDWLSIIRMAFTAAPSAVFYRRVLTICSQPAPLIR